MTSCEEPGCERDARTRGRCHTHYEFARRTGTIQRIREKDPEARFWSYVDKDGPIPERRPELGACWVWTGARNWAGYGRIHFLGKQSQAHRVGYEIIIGLVPEALDLDHLCRNRSCVRHDHLEPVTPGENLRRGFGASGLNVRKTHCPAGHEYTPDNTHLASNGNRKCRQCMHEYSADRAAEAKRARQAATRTEACGMCDTVFTFAGNRPKKYCSESCRRRAAADASARHRSKRSREGSV